jgi:hypothetical protein
MPTTTLQDLNVAAPGWSVQCHGCGMWHRKSVWLNGVPYGRLCLGEAALAAGPKLGRIAQGSDLKMLRRLARAAARARVIELNRQMRAPFEELEEEAALVRAQHRQEANAYAAATAAQEAAEDLSATPFRISLSPKAIAAIGALTTLLAGATLFVALLAHPHPSTFSEYMHWPTVAFGTAISATLLAAGVYLRLRSRSILPSWNS